MASLRIGASHLCESRYSRSERADPFAQTAPALRAKAAPSSSRPLVSKRVSYPGCSVLVPHGETSDACSSDTTSSFSRPATRLPNQSFDMDPLPAADHPSRATLSRSLAAPASWDDTSCTRSPRRGAGSLCRTGTRMRRGICGLWVTWARSSQWCGGLPTRPTEKEERG
jgi:hypothetical protein